MKALRQQKSFDAQGHFLLEQQASVIREKLAEILKNQPFLKQILCFYPFGSEIPLLPLYKKIIAEYLLYFPVTREKDLTFYRVSSIENASFVSGKMGISEPSERQEAYGVASDGVFPRRQTGIRHMEKDCTKRQLSFPDWHFHCRIWAGSAMAEGIMTGFWRNTLKYTRLASAMITKS